MISLENIEFSEYKQYVDKYVETLRDNDIVVNNLNDALKLAEDYKKSGKYDLFRGQSGIWPLISSRNRLDDDGLEEANARLSKLFGWSVENRFSENLDFVETIAQHYGIPTLLIDFTTDPRVAGYFASDKSGYEPNEYSCIYCLNTIDFSKKISFFKKISKLSENSYPRLLNVNIDNLWRLEAQRGKLLYQPAINFDSLYSAHRIVFKINDNDIKYFEESYIYPKVKSALEENLDRFFYYEKQEKRIDSLHELMNQIKDSGMHIEHFEMDDELYIKEFISDEEKLFEHKWKQEDLEKWDNRIVEKYKDIYTTEKFLFKIDSFEYKEKNKVLIFEQFTNFLSKDNNIRRKAIMLSIVDNKKNIELVKKFEQYSNLIWNGMRKLPYTNDEIAEVLGNLIQILDISVFEYEKYDKNFLKIGFSDIIGAGNNAFVNSHLLYEAMRDDLENCIVENTKDVSTIIYHIRSPELLYKFESLKKLFVKSIILSQVVYGGNDFVIFSPTEVRVLGLP